MSLEAPVPVKFTPISPSAIKHPFLRPLANKFRLPDLMPTPRPPGTTPAAGKNIKMAEYHPFLKVSEPMTVLPITTHRQSIRCIPFHYPNLRLTLSATNHDNRGS